MDNCTILAETGGDFRWPFLLVGVLVAVVGALLIVASKRRARRHRRTAGAWVLAAAVVLGGSGAALVPMQAYAATDNCDTITPAEPTAPVATSTPEPTVDPPADPTDPTDPGNTDPEDPGTDEPELVAPVAAGGAGTVATFEWQNSQRDYVPGSEDQLAIVAAPTFAFDVLTNASATAPATLDPATVDLDPSTAGVQRSIVTEFIVASIDPATGIITVSLTLPVGASIGIADIEQLLTSVQYTVSDSNGLTSNAATISISSIITRVAAET